MMSNDGKQRLLPVQTRLTVRSTVLHPRYKEMI